MAGPFVVPPTSDGLTGFGVEGGSPRVLHFALGVGAQHRWSWSFGGRPVIVACDAGGFE